MTQNGTTILVVEDEFLVREMIAEKLRDAGFAVLEAPDGEAAAGMLNGAARIDLLFTDIRLPGGPRRLGDRAARAARPRNAAGDLRDRLHGRPHRGSRRRDFPAQAVSALADHRDDPEVAGVVRDPEKACPGVDPGWIPVFG